MSGGIKTGRVAQLDNGDGGVEEFGFSLSLGVHGPTSRPLRDDYRRIVAEAEEQLRTAWDAEAKRRMTAVEELTQQVAGLATSLGTMEQALNRKAGLKWGAEPVPAAAEPESKP